MTNIFWEKEFETGIEAIDNQHFEFISSLKKYFSINIDYNFEEIKDTIYEDIRSHFHFEEDLMKKTKYLGFYSHKMEHERFLSKFYLNFTKEKLCTEQIMHDYLLSMFTWFQNHLEINDRKLSVHLKDFNTYL